MTKDFKMEHTVSVTDRSIQSSGLPKNYMEAIAEFIWNSFDASASSVDIKFDANELDHINSVSIEDNGLGIDFATLSDTFGNFNDSLKKLTYNKASSALMGRKGRGRFAFATFSGEACWQSVFQEKDSGKLLEYDITIRNNSKNKFETSNQVVSKKTMTGTTVTFASIFDVTGYSFESEEFNQFLAKEFGWFLLLNQEKGYGITINSNPVDYSKVVVERDVQTIAIRSNDGLSRFFKVSFVRWSEKIGERFYFYFLNSSQQEVFKSLTKFNNNAIGFNHSVYIESRFFDDFAPTSDSETGSLFDMNGNQEVFKKLMSSSTGS